MCYRIKYLIHGQSKDGIQTNEGKYMNLVERGKIEYLYLFGWNLCFIEKKKNKYYWEIVPSVFYISDVLRNMPFWLGSLNSFGNKNSPFVFLFNDSSIPIDVRVFKYDKKIVKVNGH